MMRTVYGWRKRPIKSSDLLGAGCAATCGFSRSFSCRPIIRAAGGNELLKRTFEHAKKSCATKRALITFTFNTVSQGLYIRNGLFPRFPIYNFSVERERLTGCVRGQQFRHECIEEAAPHLLSLARIDAAAMGVAREKHHRYLINDGLTKGFGLYAGDDCVGYVYIDRS